MAFITTDEVKAELRIPDNDTEQDDLIAVLILAVLSLWDKITDRVWAPTAHTEYYNSRPGNDRLVLNNFPIAEGSLSIWDDPNWDFDSNDLLTEDDDYKVDYTKGIIYRDGPFYEGNQSIKVTYTAGYSDSAFPAAYKQALRRQVCYFYNMSKTKTWGQAFTTKTGGGGAQSFNVSILEGDLLPDFLLLANLERRTNV